MPCFSIGGAVTTTKLVKVFPIANKLEKLKTKEIKKTIKINLKRVWVFIICSSFMSLV